MRKEKKESKKREKIKVNGGVSHTRLYPHPIPNSPLKPFQIPIQIPIPATYSIPITHVRTTSKGHLQMGL